jgi:hypothetical protein
MSTPASRHPSAPVSPEEGPLGDSAGAVLSFRTTAGWGNVPGNWAASVSTQAATFEAWIRTTVKDPVGPVLTAQGLLCTDNNASGAGTAFLRSVDLQTGHRRQHPRLHRQRPGGSRLLTGPAAPRPARPGCSGQRAPIRLIDERKAS